MENICAGQSLWHRDGLRKKWVGIGSRSEQVVRAAGWRHFFLIFLPALINIARGELRFVGVAPRTAGERAVREVTEHHLIVRTAWLYGIQGHNFLKTMLKLTHANPSREFKVVSDQFGSPTWSYRLALQIEKLVEKGARGIYHATAEGVCTWYDLADYFLNKMNVPHCLVPCTSEEFPTAAVRPKNSILENRRLKEAGINIMAPWQDDVAQYIEQFGKQLLQSLAV